MNLDRQKIKKVPELKSFHTYLQKVTNSGFITRQELVSMLPPLFLDIQKDDLVLDMCAAPGSKTSQIVEFLSEMGENKGNLAQGGVFANEIDFKRSYILSHQLKRLNSPGIAVINHAAQFLPTLYDDEVLKTDNYDNKVYFDKVLVDAPCSGDGALRKLPGRWRKWSPIDGVHLHKLQVQILMRALKVVKIGGLVVYSTCSLNCVENEAVVAEIMRTANSNDSDSLELLDVHNSLKGLKMTKGLSKWKFLLNKQGNYYENLDEEEKKKVKKEGENGFCLDVFNTYEEFIEKHANHPKLSQSVTKSMFSANLEKLNKEIGIEKTARIMPHDNNSGGFYLAVFRKKKYVHFWNDEAKEKNEQDNDSKDAMVEEKPESEFIKEEKEPENKEAEEKIEFKQSTHKLCKSKDLAVTNDVEPSVIEVIKKEYGLLDNFPSHLLIVTAEPSKKIQMISQKIKNTLKTDTKKNLKYIYLGTTVFVRNKSGNDFWRLSQNGIHLIKPFMTKNKVEIDKNLFLFIIRNNQSFKFDDIKDDVAEWKDKLQALDEGSYCLIYKNGTEEEYLIINRMKFSIGIMVAKEDLEGLRVKYLIE